MITKPIRMYLLLLFVTVAGVGSYMILQQNNDDYDNLVNQSGQSLKAVPVTKATPTPAASATPAAKSASAATINTEAEANALDSLLSSVPASDFNSSTLNTSSLGL